MPPAEKSGNPARASPPPSAAAPRNPGSSRIHWPHLAGQRAGCRVGRWWWPAAARRRPIRRRAIRYPDRPRPPQPHATRDPPASTGRTWRGSAPVARPTANGAPRQRDGVRSGAGRFDIQPAPVRRSPTQPGILPHPSAAPGGAARRLPGWPLMALPGGATVSNQAPSHRILCNLHKKPALSPLFWKSHEVFCANCTKSPGGRSQNAQPGTHSPKPTARAGGPEWLPARARSAACPPAVSWPAKCMGKPSRRH